MMGERSPLWHTNARGVFFGLSLATRKAALTRSILEGAAFALRHNVEVAAGAGAEVREMRSVGGCSRSDLWNQIKADVLGLPVLLPRTSVGSPFGAAILAGMGAGAFPDVRKSLLEMVTARPALRAEPGQPRKVYAHLPGVSRYLRAPEGRFRSRGRHHPVNLLQKLDGSLDLGRGVLLGPPENRRHDGGQFLQQGPVHLSQQAHERSPQDQIVEVDHPLVAAP